MNIKDFILGYLIGKGDGGGGASVEPLSVTQNGEYSEEGVAYSPVTVNVAGGGGGLEYEEGTWSPTEDISKYRIQLNNTHDTPPAFYAVVDVTGTNPVTNSNVETIFFDNTFVGGPVFNMISGTAKNYGTAVFGAVIPENLSFSTRNFSTRSTSGDPSTKSEYDMRGWADESTILAYCNSTTAAWKAGRTYKWIAIWK